MNLVQAALTVGVPMGLGTVIAYRYMTSVVYNRQEKTKEPPFTSIVMCALNEETFIQKALTSLADQNIVVQHPSNFEFLLVDSHSEDDTAAIAEDHGWKVYQASRGKLNARHLGMMKAKGSVVFSVDADTYYPPNWLNVMLRWFNFRHVVGVVGPRLITPEESLLATYMSVVMALIDVGPLMAGGMRAPGQSMAVYRNAYFDVGGFNLNINQLDMHAMVREEEIRFAFKLRRLGSMPVEWRAPCFTSLRRVRGIGKGKGYKQWTLERLQGRRF